MHHEDDGEPMIDETRDGYSVYHVVRGTGHAARMSGRCIHPDSAHKWQEMPSPLIVQADDFVEEIGASNQLGLIITSGAKTFDVVWIGGSTTRYRHGERNIRIVSSAGIDACSRDHLLREVDAARRERRAGARIRRGMVSPRR